MKTKYKFKKSDGGPIPTTEAETWMKRYKEKHPNGPWAYFFGEELIRKILDQPEAVGMRVYLGYNEDGVLQMALVGAREDGSNILSNGAEGKDGNGERGLVGDNGSPCPPYCP